MKYIIVIALSALALLTSSNAQDQLLPSKELLPNPFGLHQQQADNTSLAILDKSAQSLALLEKSYGYLIENEIPVMMVAATKEETTVLFEKYKGLLIGPAPDEKVIKLLLSKYGIQSLPAVIERGKVYQGG